MRLMPACRSLFFTFLLAFISATHISPQSPPAGEAALSPTLNQVIQKLGSRAPEDAVILGNVTITAGSTEEKGTVRIVTKKTTHTVETFDTPTTSHHVVFAAGVAAERKKNGLKELPFGRSLSARSALSPLTFIASRLEEAKVQVEDLGPEAVDGRSALHLRISNDWSKDKYVAGYQEFTKCDVWVDPVTFLPRAISFSQREGLGAIPWVAVRVEYDDYRAIGGFLYPYHITKYVNGTKWADIDVTSIAFNTGVAAEEFAIK